MLDHIIWTALTTQHRSLAEGDELALRYPEAMASFAAVREPSAAAWRSLAALIPPQREVALFTPEEVHPEGLLVTTRESVDQMIAPAHDAPQPPSSIEPHRPSAVLTAGRRARPSIVPLGDADAAEMRALVELTNPGPFSTRTHELGRFVGVRDRGRLVAMTGERMHLDGYTEISGVCVHPDHRGKGYAAELVRTVAHMIRARGETPMLHVRSNNDSAIALYRKLGFTLRRAVHLAVLTH